MGPAPSICATSHALCSEGEEEGADSRNKDRRLLNKIAYPEQSSARKKESVFFCLFVCLFVCLFELCSAPRTAKGSAWILRFCRSKEDSRGEYVS